MRPVFEEAILTVLTPFSIWKPVVYICWGGGGEGVSALSDLRDLYRAMYNCVCLACRFIAFKAFLKASSAILIILLVEDLFSCFTLFLWVL